MRVARMICPPVLLPPLRMYSLLETHADILWHPSISLSLSHIPLPTGRQPSPPCL